MRNAIGRFCLGVLLLMGLIGAAHAVYVAGNPLSYVDPEGLSPKGFPQRPIDLMPLEGGGSGFSGPTVSGPSPFRPARTGASQRLPDQCPPEVQATLERIKSGQSFPHRNDGTIFKNKEGLLPPKPEGYYREWVHPTEGVPGPGMQRVVTGQGGEAYYSPDHYGTFIPLP